MSTDFQNPRASARGAVKCQELAQWIARLQSIPGFKDEARRWYLELTRDTSGQWRNLSALVAAEVAAINTASQAGLKPSSQQTRESK